MMKKHQYIVYALLCALIALPITTTSAHAARLAKASALYSQDSTIDATIYLTTSTLQTIFQNKISKQVPGTVANLINTMVSKLPATDRGWASEMASSLIQPSATLNSLTPQQNGLVTSLRISLYPGDPHPITTSMLVTFSVQNSSTIQVSAQPINGSPALLNGPLTTFQIPVGQLNSIHAMSTCGDAVLAVDMQYPISLTQRQQTSTSLPGQTSTSSTSLAIPQQQSLIQRAIQTNNSSYIAIPATALASLGSSIGSIPINSMLTAKNIHLSVQGSELVITSDIYLGFFQIGTATTHLQPTANNGSLAVNVQKTDLTFLQIFTFPNNSYNQQIEQILNAKLSGALAGKFSVTNATIGPNSHTPCLASDSLVLTGTTNLL